MDQMDEYEAEDTSTSTSTSTSTDRHLGTLRSAATPAMTAQPVGTVPYSAIVTVGRRRQRTRRLAGVTAGVAAIVAGALAVPALASGGSTEKLAPAAADTSGNPAPAAAAPSPPAGQNLRDLLRTQHQYSINHGTAAGHTWEVKVTIENDERAFMLSHPAAFPDGAKDYDSIPYSWFLLTIDGHPAGMANGDLLPAPTPPGNPLSTLGAVIGWNTTTHQATAMLEYGPVNDAAVDHYAIVYATHTDRLDPVKAGDHRYIAFTVTAADRPTAVVAYDKNNREISRGTGFVVDYFKAKP